MGAVYAARVTELSARLGLARLDLGGGQVGSVRLRPGAETLYEGQRLTVEVIAETTGGKPALLRPLEAAALDRPGLLASPPTVEARLHALAAGQPLTDGGAAREAADLAQVQALAGRLALGGGPAAHHRAHLRPGGGGCRSGARRRPCPWARPNLQAVAHAARLLRLKGLAGLAVIDLIGFPKDRRRLLDAAAAAFGPDGPQAVIGALGRFGTLEVAKPHLEQPVAERLLGSDGRPTARTAAQDLVRALERQGRFQPGRRLEAVCAPDVAAALRPLAARLGLRFGVREGVGLGREHTDIVAL